MELAHGLSGLGLTTSLVDKRQKAKDIDPAAQLPVDVHTKIQYIPTDDTHLPEYLAADNFIAGIATRVTLAEPAHKLPDGSKVYYPQLDLSLSESDTHEHAPLYEYVGFENPFGYCRVRWGSQELLLGVR